MTTNIAAIAGEGRLLARFETSLGTMVAELYEHRAPQTVDNFVGLATGTKTWTDPDTGNPGEGPFYDGTIFHRVIPQFMAQGGDRTGTGRGGPGYKFADEFHPELRHDGPGVLSMANAGPNSNGSQFFLCEVATPHLNDRHSVFGKVIEGTDVISTITGTPRGPMDRPLENVVLKKLTIYRDPA